MNIMNIPRFTAEVSIYRSSNITMLHQGCTSTPCRSLIPHSFLRRSHRYRMAMEGVSRIGSGADPIRTVLAPVVSELLLLTAT